MPATPERCSSDPHCLDSEKVNDQLDGAGKLAASGDEPGFTAVAQDVFPEGENAEIDEDLHATTERRPDRQG